MQTLAQAGIHTGAAHPRPPDGGTMGGFKGMKRKKKLTKEQWKIIKAQNGLIKMDKEFKKVVG